MAQEFVGSKSIMAKQPSSKTHFAMSPTNRQSVLHSHRCALVALNPVARVQFVKACFQTPASLFLKSAIQVRSSVSFFRPILLNSLRPQSSTTVPVNQARQHAHCVRWTRFARRCGQRYVF